MEQQSSALLFQLQNIEINGDTQKFALFVIALRAILTLGDHEHTGDWDPYLQIKLKDPSNLTSFNGSDSDLDEALSADTIESESGYTEISFDDFNPEEEKSILSNHSKITEIIIEVPGPGFHHNTISVQIPLSNILSISVHW